LIKIIIISIFIFISSSKSVLAQSEKSSDSSNYFFKFLTNEIGNAEEIERRYYCMYPNYVNTNFNFGSGGKQKYPNPCSPSMHRAFIIFIPDFANFTFAIYDENGTTIFSFEQQNLSSGLYRLLTEELYLKNIIASNILYKGEKRKLILQHIIKISINQKEFEYKVFRI